VRIQPNKPKRKQTPKPHPNPLRYQDAISGPRTEAEDRARTFPGAAKGKETPVPTPGPKNRGGKRRMPRPSLGNAKPRRAPLR
jgi:hypothetical protein